jgi:transposase, IS5 family
VLHAKALPGNPCDGHTLAAAIEGTAKLTGCEVELAYVDKGYRGHKTVKPRRVRSAASSALFSASYDADPPSVT